MSDEGRRRSPAPEPRRAGVAAGTVKRPQLTARAAVLAVVVCAIAMSLAYPVREYIALRRNIAQLEQEKARELAAIRALEDRRRQLEDPGYKKQVARERLFYCEPGRKCYVVMDDEPAGAKGAAAQRKAAVPPWYQTLWESVEAADTGKGRRAPATGGGTGAARPGG
ncbi:septum formation initiator family protein [Planomonospora sp. ID82291]|uniref:FtsB family cell division protein n=1 Tax=Planomonospora sp. ID82291 TaxID=2738136 RepID=UPI0018C35C67|nr:septum formation initiator family protein [Planomonospora sp. ID82291]MBG0814973.1 septum formation initiator family protein [Planomonospora sp. ID82291]